MKKTIISMISILSIIILVIIFSYNSVTIKADKKDFKAMESGNRVRYDITIHKINETNEILSGAVFKISDLKGITSHIISESKEQGKYILTEDKEYPIENLIELFYSSETLKKFKTKDDILNSNLNTYCTSTYCDIYEYIPFTIEEIKSPSGYMKEKAYLIGRGQIYVSFNNNNFINYASIYIDVDSLSYINYDSIENPENLQKDLNGENYYALDIRHNCPPLKIDENQFNENKIELSSILVSGNCPFDIVDKKGTIELSVENYVNKKQNVLTTSNKKLSYSIVVKNSGTAPSTDNIIISNIPKGLEYVEESASHSGEYNKEDHKVQWNIEELDAEETLELTYEAIIPKDANPKLEYIGTTSINSREVSTEIKSKETVVNLEKTTQPIQNPQTSNFINFIILTIFGLTSFGVYLTSYKKRNNN